jgi:hypothetical protein
MADARRLAAESSARAVELEIERAGRSADMAWRKRSLDNLMRLLSGFRSAKENGLAAEVLTSLWVLEWAHGPTLLQDPAATSEIWSMRIEVLGSVRDQARAAGGADSIQARLTEPSLALWLLREGRVTEARAILDEAIAYWQRHTVPDDPWMIDLRVLESAAVLLAAEEAGAALAPAERARLAEHEARLRGVRDARGPAGEAAPLMQLISGILQS